MSSASPPPKIPHFLQSLLNKRKPFESRGDIRSRETAIKIMLKNTHANFDGLFLATVAATIHPRHLWSMMQYPPLGPATTPWAFQEAFKALVSLNNSIINDNNNNNNIKDQQQDAGQNAATTATPETNLIDQLLERSVKKLSELRKSFRQHIGGKKPPTDVKSVKEDRTSSSTSTTLSSSPMMSSCVSIKPDEKGDGVNGSVIISKPVPPSTTIFKVPGHLLFNALTVAQYSKLGSLLTQEPWKSALDTEDEALLILTLIYEKSVVGTANSRWKDFLETCPKHFPHIPLCWDEEDLMSLDPSMFAAVAEKGQTIQIFVDQCRALLAKVEETYPTHFHKNSLIQMVSAETVTWARCVFDSRSFVLKYDGEKERTTLSPFIDMLNHDCYSDILSRRIVVAPSSSSAAQEDDNDSSDKAKTTSENSSSKTNFFFEMISSPFEMGSGAGKKGGEDDNDDASNSLGCELFLSYGPLETWELLISYGFVLEGSQDGKNVYDVLQLPIEYDADYLLEDDENEDQDEKRVEVIDEDDPLSHLRKKIIKKCGLESIQKHGLYIPVDGKIPLALRHIISIWHEQEEKYLKKHLSLIEDEDIGFTGFDDGDSTLDRLLSKETLASVNETCEAALTMMLEQASPHSLEQDLEDLKKAKNDNVKAAVVARLTLKNIAKRGLERLNRKW